MRGFGQALLEDYGDKLDPTGQDYLRRIIRAGGSMERLIDDLLEYSRLGRVQVETRPTRVDAVFSEVLRPLASEIERTRATIEMRRPMLDAEAEPQLLTQALSNLVTNALKYVAPGTPPALRLRTEAHGDRVRIVVEDEGLGIAPEHLERIWRPFERLHGSEAYPGTGVGLAIVERAAERMGGTAGVESEPGKGSRFWVELPAAAGGAP